MSMEKRSLKIRTVLISVGDLTHISTGSQIFLQKYLQNMRARGRRKDEETYLLNKKLSDAFWI